MSTIEESFDCDDIAGDSGDYGLRIGALFAIMGVSLIGGALPWLCKSSRLRKPSVVVPHRLLCLDRHG